MRNDVRRLVKDLVQQGFTVGQTRRGHLQVRRAGVVVAVLSGSPSDWRAGRNALARLHRGGYVSA